MTKPPDPFVRTYLELQAKVAPVKPWIRGKLDYLVLAAFVLGLFSFFAIPDLYRNIRLVSRGTTTAVVIVDGHSDVFYGGPTGESFTRTTARIVGNTNEFPADKVYKKGDHAYLTYSDRAHYGVITATRTRSYYDFWSADGEALAESSYPIGLIVFLTLTNVCLILMEVLEHVFGAGVTSRLMEACGTVDRAEIIGRVWLEGLLAGSLSLAPIAATVAAFSVSVKMDSDTLWTAYAIYGLLVLFFASHISAKVAIGLLRFLRTTYGTDLKKIVAYVVSLTAVIDFIIRLLQLTFSDRILDLSSWSEVGTKFIKSFF